MYICIHVSAHQLIELFQQNKVVVHRCSTTFQKQSFELMKLHSSSRNFVQCLTHRSHLFDCGYQVRVQECMCMYERRCQIKLKRRKTSHEHTMHICTSLRIKGVSRSSLNFVNFRTFHEVVLLVEHEPIQPSLQSLVQLSRL